MRVIKIPKFEKIKCSCGCIYEVDEYDDIEIIKEKDIFGKILILEECARCPFCDKLNELKRIEDINGGKDNDK